MKKNKLLLTISIITTLSLITTGCGKIAKTKNNEEVLVSIKKSKISVDKYYEEIKKDNISKLVEMIDHKILDKKYKTDDKEKESIEKQINQIKNYYQTDETFTNAIKQYFGVNTEDELKEKLSLEYKRNLAVEDYIKETLTEKEIKEYYDNNITGDIKASHILIKPNVKDDASDEEKEKAEKKALKKAKKIITKLDNGEKFEDLAKEYSDDSGSASNGGDLGYFESDEMDEDFIKAVNELKNNEYTKEPVKTQFGYHIILKVDQKEKKSLKKIKKDIKEKLKDKKLSEDKTLYYKSLINIRKKYNIKFNDKEIKKAYNNLMNELIKSVENTETN